MSTKDKRKRERLLARREAAVNRATAKRRKREWKAEQRAERDEIVARALQKHQTVEQKFALAPLDQGIKEAVLRRARKLVDERFKEGLLFLSRESGNWVRDIADWKPKGKSPGS